MPSYERGVANIDFVISQLRQSEPIADYDHLTMVGHSQGGDISVFYAAGHPDSVVKVVTLDNLRVPLRVREGQDHLVPLEWRRLLQAGSRRGAERADCEKEGIQVVMALAEQGRGLDPSDPKWR